MRGQHRRAVSREVVRREAAEHVGDLDHDRASEAGHQPIEETVQRRTGGRGEMGVDGGGGDVGVAERPRAIMHPFYVIVVEGSVERDLLLAGTGERSARNRPPILSPRSPTALP